MNITNPDPRSCAAGIPFRPDGSVRKERDPGFLPVNSRSQCKQYRRWRYSLRRGTEPAYKSRAES